jgi:hypothetical protein
MLATITPAVFKSHARALRQWLTFGVLIYGAGYATADRALAAACSETQWGICEKRCAESNKQCNFCAVGEVDGKLYFGCAS